VAETFLQDIRYGIRMLAKSPGFAAIAILTLALGIGANTAIFSLTDQVLLRLLPVQRPDELVVLRSPGPFSGRTWSDGDTSASFSYPMYKELRDRTEVFAGLLGRFSVSLSIAGQGDTERGRGELVTGNYFEVLGVQPAIGRVFTPEDETAPGANPVAVLSYGYWTRRFGNSPAILNQQLSVNGASLTVVGVARAGFTGVQIGQVPDIFIPITMKAQMTPNWNGLDEHKDRWMAILGRLKRGFTRAKAEAGLQSPFRSILEAELPLFKFHAETERRFLDRRIVLDPGAHGRPILQHDAQQPLLFLMAMVGLVLLIACANLASLLVARGETRQREIAVRLALGAGRWRLVRQLLTENLLLSLVGGACGLIVGWWTLRVLVDAIPQDVGAVGFVARIDSRMLFFAIGISILTALFFGFAPALRASRADLQATLKDQGASVSEGKSGVRLRKLLLVTQMTLTAVLLVGAGLFARSLVNLGRADLGLRTDHVLQFSIAPELNRYSPEQTIALADRMRGGIAAIPAVRQVSAGMIAVLEDSNSDSNITVEGYTAQENENMNVSNNWVGPNFFATLGIPLLKGREFTEADSATSPKVAIISELTARRFFAGRDPIGLHFAFGSGDKVHPDIEIVGVVKNSKNIVVREQFRPFAYLPYSQNPKLGEITFYVRTEQDPAAMATTLRETVAGYDANLPIFNVKTLVQQVDDLLFADRLVTFLTLCLGLLASLLAAVGLYGVMAYIVTRRTREIGIRMALGATQGSVAWLILREVAQIAAIGLAIGLATAFGAGRLVESLLFGVKASDPLVFVLASVLLVAVALLAGSLPARKAAGVDPMVALRYE
jgi:putative ABC transport system permease protein